MPLVKLFQFWPLEVVSVGFCVPLAYSQYWYLYFCFCFWFFSSSWLPVTTRCSRIILYIFCPNPGINYFSKEPWFFLLKNDIRHQTLGARYKFTLGSICVVVESALEFNSTLEWEKKRFKAWFYYFLTVSSWLYYLASLPFSFLLCSILVMANTYKKE